MTGKPIQSPLCSAWIFQTSNEWPYDDKPTVIRERLPLVRVPMVRGVVQQFPSNLLENSYSSWKTCNVSGLLRSCCIAWRTVLRYFFNHQDVSLRNSFFDNLPQARCNTFPFNQLIMLTWLQLISLLHDNNAIHSYDSDNLWAMVITSSTPRNYRPYYQVWELAIRRPARWSLHQSIGIFRLAI